MSADTEPAADVAARTVWFVGCAEVSRECLSRLLAAEVRVDGVLTLPPDAEAQYGISGYASLAPLADRYGIPVHYPNDYTLRSEADHRLFADHRPDLLVVVGWQRLIPDDLLATLPLGAVGVHGSSQRLPKGRGRSPINWSLIEGRDRFVLHLFYLAAGADDGDIIGTEEFEINPFDTCQTLYLKNAVVTSRLLLHYWRRMLAGTTPRMPQAGVPTYYPKRSPEDGRIVWQQSTNQIYNMVRALTKPYPGAFSMLGERQLHIWRAQPFDRRIAYPNARPGEIVESFVDGPFAVRTGSDTLLVTDCEGASRHELQCGTRLS